MNLQLVSPHPNSADFGITSCYNINFKDNRKNLYYRHRISLQEAIECKPMRIPLLNGKVIMMPIDQIITPQTVKCIKGEGMPVYKAADYMNEQTERGDLYILFDIVFP